MSTTVAQLFDAAGLRAGGVVRWGAPLPEGRPGVYVVALGDDPGSVAAAQAECPLSMDAVRRLLDVRPELRVDGRRPAEADLAARLAACWLADEVVVYVGLAGTSLARRVRDFYKTPLGARGPHAGGWPLKTLAVLEDLSVHYAVCDDVDDAERAMLSLFMRRVDPVSRAALCDPDVPLPFANLEAPRAPRKRHGITGARQPKATTDSTADGGALSEADAPSPPERVAAAGRLAGARLGEHAPRPIAAIDIADRAHYEPGCLEVGTRIERTEAGKQTR